MNIRFCIKFIICLLTVKFAFADIVDVNNEQILELSKTNISIVDVRRSSEWDKEWLDITLPNKKSVLDSYLYFKTKDGNSKQVKNCSNPYLMAN
tara:strand:- start:1192 stop:1473 length:282 start_codon:yes stop_codon:yes gene_type:complete